MVDLETSLSLNWPNIMVISIINSGESKFSRYIAFIQDAQMRNLVFQSSLVKKFSFLLVQHLILLTAEYRELHQKNNEPY